MDIIGAIIDMGPFGLLLAAFVLLLSILLVLILGSLFGLRRSVKDLRSELNRVRDTIVAEQRRITERHGAPDAPVSSQRGPTAPRTTDVAQSLRRAPLVARRD